MSDDLRAQYQRSESESFAEQMEIAFVSGGRRDVLQYEKVTWQIDGVRKGLRYGDNPGQPAALYRLCGGNLQIGQVETLAPGRDLVSGAELLQSGKHPGKTNLTDADAALNILRFLADRPSAVIVKHNNPCGVAVADSLGAAFERAYGADRVAAFGGCVALSHAVDTATAQRIRECYFEVVVAPEFDPGSLAILCQRPNLRILRIRNMQRLCTWADRHYLDFKCLLDGGIVVQRSFLPHCRTVDQLLIPRVIHEDKEYSITRLPTQRERADMIFGWLVEAGVTSNSILYVKDGQTLGIGTGEQDRLGAAEIARDKAYRKMADRLCFTRHGCSYWQLTDPEQRADIDAEVAAAHGGLPGAVMVSDAFFPFRDGVDIGLREGVTAVVQPGGSVNDFQVIAACNEAGATMMFTGERSFRH